MKNLQPIFFTSNPDRASEFALETRIWQKDGSLVSEKRTAEREAKKHLEDMLKTYKTLSSLTQLKEKAIVVPAIKKADVVEFEYIEGTSAERLLIDALLEGREKEAEKIIGRIIELIKSLPSEKSKPTDSPEYVKVFGNTYSRCQECSTIGLIDLNFDNFIVDDEDNWHLIDYEWCFDFAVSKDFLIQRLLWWLIVRYQETFRYHCQKLNSLAVADNFYVPEFIYKKYQAYLSNLVDLQIAENCFQSYVRGVSIAQNSIQLYSSPKKASPPTIGLSRLLLHERRAKDMRAHIKKIEDRNDQLRDELRSILGSNSYKAAQKLSKIKRLFKP